MTQLAGDKSSLNVAIYFLLPFWAIMQSSLAPSALYVPLLHSHVQKKSQKQLKVMVSLQAVLSNKRLHSLIKRIVYYSLVKMCSANAKTAAVASCFV